VRNCRLIQVLLLGLTLPVLVPASGIPEQTLPDSALAEFTKAVRLFEAARYPQALEALLPLEKRYPNIFDIQQLLAITLDLSGRTKDANNHFRKAVAVNPTSVQARTNLGTSLVRLGDIAGAVPQFEQALKLDPANATANFNLGTILLRQKKYRDALPRLEKAYEVQPKIYENGYHLALCHFALEDFGQVEKVLESLRPVPGERTEYFLILALTQRALGRNDEAQKNLKRILPVLVAHPAGHQEVALLLFSQGLFQEALPILREAVRQFPDSVPALRNLGIAEFQTGDLDQAKTHVEAAQALQESPDGHILLADILEASGRPMEAIEHYQRAVALDPSEPIIFAYGYSFLTHWNWNEAAAVFEGALRRHPGSWKLLIGLGVAQMGNNEPEKATATFLRATAVAPDAVLGYKLLSQSFGDSTESFAGAVRRFQEFGRNHPDNAWAVYYEILARFRLAERGQGPLNAGESIARLERLLADHPDFFEACSLMGEISFREKDWEAAGSAFERAVALDPGDIQTRYKYGLSLQRMGRTEQAKAELQRYQELKEQLNSAMTERMARTTKFMVDLKK